MKKNKKKPEENKNNEKSHPLVSPHIGPIAKNITPPPTWGAGWYYAPGKEIGEKYGPKEIAIGKKKGQTERYVSAKDNLLFTKDLKADITIGKLSSYNDGTIRYGNNIMKLRSQLKDLCRLFMRHPNRLLLIDDVRDEIIKADRRKSTSSTTIAKYVSELHNSLKIHFKKDVIFNQKEEGWYFKP